ncbi:MAG: glycosyltransferase family 4 protein [Nanoarchaeota archaeon]
MKIAHVCSEYRPAISGVGQVVEELAKRQVKAGHEVHVYAPDWDKKNKIKEREEIIDGIHVHRIKHIARIANFATLFPGVFYELVKGKYDVIHSHVFGHLHFVLSAIAAKLTKAKHIHTTHCPWTDAHRSLIGNLGILISYNIFSRFALQITDKIIAITPWELDFIRKYGGNEKKIIVLPNGMAEEFFIKIKNNDFKKKQGIKKEMVLFFGRLSVTKGPDKFVEIAHLVLKKRPDARFVIRGPDEGMLAIVKKKIGNEKRIILLEATRERKDILKMYQAADVFVMPSFREGLPLTLFEAMASGLPVVASPVNGIPYEMKDKRNGFLIEYGDNEKFAEKIIELIDDKKLRNSISKNNLSKSKNYKWDDITKKTLALYKK